MKPRDILFLTISFFLSMVAAQLVAPRIDRWLTVRTNVLEKKKAIAQMDPCYEDRRIICSMIPEINSFEIKKCLIQNQKALTAACYQAEIEPIKTILKPCEEEIAKYCPNLLYGTGEIRTCLLQNKQNLNPQCASSIATPN